MGMAASQARYLELTARKSNVEFEGQQINQQRTALANESAGIFSQMMGLTVPTAPSSSDYTTTSYTFNDGANTCTIANGGITSLTGDPNYNATVTYSYPVTNYTGLSKTRTDLGIKNEGTSSSPVYWITDGSTTNPQNKTQLTQCSTSDSNYTTDKAAVEQIISSTGSTSNFATDYGTGTTKDITKIYKYTSNGTTYYLSSTDVANLAKSSGAAGSLTNYYASNITSQKSETEKAYVTQTDTGRYNSIKLASGSSSLDLNATTTTDQNAYNDAVNEYEYQQSIYQQQISNLNSKTSIIQNQDKTLELKLRQLDTEREALSTEMDSVKKVIDKNIESTFKTFSN